MSKSKKDYLHDSIQDMELTILDVCQEIAEMETNRDQLIFEKKDYVKKLQELKKEFNTL